MPPNPISSWATCKMLSWSVFSSSMQSTRSETMQSLREVKTLWRWCTLRRWSPRSRPNSDKSLPWKNLRKMCRSKRTDLPREPKLPKEPLMRSSHSKNLSRDSQEKDWLPSHSLEVVIQNTKKWCQLRNSNPNWLISICNWAEDKFQD